MIKLYAGHHRNDPDLDIKIGEVCEVETYGNCLILSKTCPNPDYYYSRANHHNEGVFILPLESIYENVFWWWTR